MAQPQGSLTAAETAGHLKTEDSEKNILTATAKKNRGADRGLQGNRNGKDSVKGLHSGNVTTVLSRDAETVLSRDAETVHSRDAETVLSRDAVTVHLKDMETVLSRNEATESENAAVQTLN